MKCNDNHKFCGKYRGKVIDNYDPLFLGRIIADVPAVSGSILNWAMPCVPYAGEQVGFYAIPPIGANVWIEFENGDPMFPIWVGCFWAEGETPIPSPDPLPIPDIKVFKTEWTTMIFNDLPEVGGFILRCAPPAVDIPLTMTWNSVGITILCPEAEIAMTHTSITITVPEAVITMDAATITHTVPEAFCTMTAESVILSLEPTTITVTPDMIAVVSPMTTVEGDVDITGAVEITGPVEITGDVAIEGAVEIVGNIDITGAVELLGNQNVLGAVEIEGDLNVAGAVEIEGDEAVAGVIEGVIVPPI